MSNTYTQLYTQVVFAVKGRQNFIKEKYREEVEKVVTSIVKDNKSKLLAIYCNPDHLHALISIHPTISLSEMIRIVKAKSSQFISETFIRNFNWQDGYGAFSYSKSQIDRVVKYVLNQPEHHKKQTFRDEYCIANQVRY